jgi:CheY-like chemotaxis protein
MFMRVPGQFRRIFPAEKIQERSTLSQVKIKILVVDKQDIYTQALIELLTEGGYNVDFCTDPDTAYRKLKTSVRPFGLLIIDLDFLQETEGYLFLKALSREELYNDLKVIITTSALMDERLSQSEKELNICAYFNKARIIEEFFLIVTDIIPPSGKDLRYFRRIPARVLVSYVVNGTTRLHYATNLSHSGIFIQNSQPDPVGTIARLSFNLPGSPLTLVATAKVMRIVQYDAPVSSLRTQNFPPGNGMAFLEISEEHKSILQTFLDREEIRIFGSKRR